MRHHSTQKKFGRTTDIRRAFFRSLMNALIEHGRITTTLPRAKAIRPMIEKMVTLARSNSLASRRIISARLGNQPERTAQLINDIAPRYQERTGGYTRILKLPQRSSDGSPMAIIEFV
jgi:large subunit ribosomal protein L17